MLAGHSPRWNKHLLGCQRKGFEAYQKGEPIDSCPYKVLNPWGHTGPKNLTKQRIWYWRHGWKNAAYEDKTGKTAD